MIQRVVVVCGLMFLLVACSSSGDANPTIDKDTTATPDISTPDPGAGASGITLESNSGDVSVTIQSSSNNNQPTNIPAPQLSTPITPSPTSLSSQLNVPASVPSNVPIIADTQTPPNQTVDCERRFDLPLYSVQTGENLTVIAQRFGVTLDEMIEWNCLANPNRLLRGDLLHVPELERFADPLCTETLDDDAEIVAIVPSANFDGACYRLTIRTQVTISWYSDEVDLAEVTFYFANDELEAAEILGIDATAFDGFSVRWTVPQNLIPSQIYASGIGMDGEVVGSDSVLVYVPQAQ